MPTGLARSEAEEDPCRVGAVTLRSAEINLAPFHAYLADLPDCENECFLCAWLIFACICSLILNLSYMLLGERKAIISSL